MRKKEWWKIVVVFQDISVLTKSNWLCKCKNQTDSNTKLHVDILKAMKTLLQLIESNSIYAVAMYNVRILLMLAI